MHPASSVMFRFGKFQLDTGRRELIGPDGVVPVQPKVYDFLLHMIESGGAVVSKEKLFKAVWPDVIVTENVLTRAARAARIALGDDATDPQYIRTQHGVGYQFIAPVERDEAPPSPGAARVRSLAILPFRTLVAEERDEVLELGLADTLITRLSKLRGLAVRSLASAKACLGAAPDHAALDAARMLDVDFFLEASLQVREARLRVNARLVSTDDGGAVWSESFDEHFADVFDLQDVICDQIASRVLPHVSDREAASGGRPVPPEAYRAFLEGRLFAGRYTHAGTLKAIEHFEQALDLAPGYAEAWAALGECHELLGIEGEQEAPTRYEAGRSAVNRALALSPHLPDAQGVLAKIAWQYDWNWTYAEETFQTLLARHPNRADLRIHYVSCLCALGRPEEAIDHARRALAVDPTSPWCHSMLAQSLHMSRRFEEARQQADWTLELAPNFAFARLFAGLSRFCLGHREAALDHLREGAATGRFDFLAMLGCCTGMAGHTDEARDILEKLKGEPAAGPFSLGVACLGCGQIADATQFFKDCVERRDWHVLLVRTDPLWDAYREHELYQSLEDVIESQRHAPDDSVA